MSKGSGDEKQPSNSLEKNEAESNINSADERCFGTVQVDLCELA